MTQRGKRVAAVIATLALVTVGWAVWAGTINVPADFATIQEAVDAASSGDTIILAPGVYNEQVTLDGKSGITIEASSGDPTATIVNGGFVIKDSDDITLQGFTVTGGFNGIFAQTTSGLHLNRMNITGNSQDGVIFTGNCSDVLIENSQITNNGKDGIDLNCSGKNIAIRNNVISFNGKTDGRGVGVRLGGAVEGVLIEGNTFEGNAFADIHPQ